MHKQTVLITGGARGIGLATAKVFLAEGAQAGIIDLEKDLAAYPDPNRIRRDWADLHPLRRLGTPDEGSLAAFGMAGRPVE